MKQKNYAEVLIDGRIYTLGGSEEEMYLQKVAAYLNEKIGRIRRQDGFSRLNSDYQSVLIQLNVADDYFKEQERADLLAEQKAALEKDTYSLKHELITTQMRLERMEKDMELEHQKLADARKHLEDGQKQLEESIQKLEDSKAKLEAEKLTLEEERQKQNEAVKELQDHLLFERKSREKEKAEYEQKLAGQQKQMNQMKTELQTLRALQAAAEAAAGRTQK